MTAIVVADLTQTLTTGTGVFDVLMRATKVHLEQEYKQNRIKGAEYATVYLGAMTAVMQSSLAFLLQKEKAGLEAEILRQQQLNLEQELLNLVAAECKLKAEYDLIQANIIKTNTENALLTQKVLTEKAQTSAVGIDADSIVGKQKALYGAQTAGFQRDAEQKAADLMVKTWMTRRTTDEGTIANSTNMLADSDIGRAVNKLLTGVGA